MPRGVRPALPRESFRLDAAKMNELPQLIKQYEEAIALADWRKAKIPAMLEELPSNERLVECVRLYWDFPKLVATMRLSEVCGFRSKREFLIEARKHRRIEIEVTCIDCKTI